MLFKKFRLLAIVFFSLFFSCSLSADDLELTDAILPRLEAPIATQLYDILKEVDTVFSENNIDFWAMFGTLLGAARHEGIIPWDDDLDLAIFDKDIGKLISLKKTFEKKGLILCVLKDYIKIYPKNGKAILDENGNAYVWKYPFVDIFPMCECEEKIHFSSEHLRSTLGIKQWLDSSDLRLPLQRVAFGPFSIPIPLHSESYLKRAYGTDCFDVAYSEYDHSREKRKQKVKVRLIDRQPAPYQR